ncbi:zinc finger protein on ecdysone puffs-like [Ostrinia furnacalis]|uniref:zinc finger protein on ecdysone puffs-like n=1 Tax=Ostrinia furnacalis TaxID=93504 RepID=UPI00103BFD1B|nr:zinc finger protein on ecdysone puffs-like [Ostrinia furnacalis]
MANRRPQQGRRIDYGRNDRNKNFGRSGVSPWQGAGPGGGMPNLLPLGGGSTEATLALASNIINLLQPRQNPVPSLLDMPIRRDFGPNMGRYDRGYVPNRMGNQGNFRRTGNYNRAGERINTNRKPFRPNDGQRQQNKSSPKKDADSKAKPKESDQDDKTEETSDGDKVEETKKEGPKTRYDDISPQLLKCHICNKSMWDGRSFENHLSGRAHAIMMQKTAESYALTADTMRQEFKVI